MTKHRPAPRYRRATRTRREPSASWRNILLHPDAHQGTRSLSIDSIIMRLDPPHIAQLIFYSSGHRLNEYAVTDDSLAARGILAGDAILYDLARKRPEDGAIMLVDEAIDPATAWPVLRVCRLRNGGSPEYHATVPGYPILSGERKVYGTLAAVVRCTEGKGDSLQILHE